MIKTLLIILTPFFMMLILSGCTANLADPEIDFEPPAYVEQMPAHEDEQNFVSTGSLFGQGDNPLFSDHKAMHVHDIVRVVISETTKSSNTAAKALDKTDTTNLNAGVFSSTSLSKLTGRANALTDIGFKSGSNSTFAGKGSSTKDASFSTTISARIVKILQNGNYYIVGKREILIDNQKQIIQISGVIRPYDIDQFNKIDSSKMSEAKILYKSEGDVNGAVEQPWGTKLIKSIWPF